MSKHSILEKIVQTTGDLPAMPHIANLVLEKTADPNTTAKQLHDLIAKDQALAARVLRIANSPFYGCARTVTRLTDAIVVMGFNAIKSLVMASVLQDFFKTYGLAEKLLWEHSLACASISKSVARQIKFPNAEEAFLAGLLHDIGKVILNLRLPDRMLLIVQEVYNTPGTSFLELEEEALGFNHAQVGELIARKWNFASEIAETIGKHHEPEKAKVLPKLTHIVSLANSLCHKLELGPTRAPELELTNLPSAGALNLDHDRLDSLLEQISQTIKSEQASLGL